MRTSKCLTIICFFGFVAFQSCDFDNLPEPTTGGCESGSITYNEQIQAILETNCAYTGCHLSGFPNGDFSAYNDDLVNFLENADFKERVIDLRDMPPEYATGPTELSEEDILSLKCWIEDGHPE